MSEAANNDVPGTESTPEAATSSATIGAQLAAARQSKEWTVEHVASQLNLAPRQIIALEADNYGALPGMASVRGFVRAYAKILKIDATPLVAMIASEQITPTPALESRRTMTAAPFADNRLLSSGRRRTSPKTILAAVVVVLLAIGAVLVERLGGWPTLSQSLSTRFKQISDTSTIDPNAPPTAGAASANADAAAPMTEAAIAPAAPASPAAEHDEAVARDVGKSAASVPPKAETKIEAPAAKIPVAAIAPNVPIGGAKNLLVLKVRQDSWVELRQGHNALISRLVKAGSTEQLEIAQPATLTLGNAAGVDVVFRGSPLEIKSDVKNNVVRLNLK